jgi:protein-S-isoprenylcysteine O-methyltransferase Ste14
MSSSRKYRFDILSLYIVTTGFLFYSVLQLKLSLLPGSVLMFCIITESFMLWEPVKNKKSNGIYPAFILCTLIISLVVLKDNSFIPGFVGNNYIAMVALVTGLIIRIISLRALKKSFSYSLAISDNQQLVVTGLYSVIRHPAYLGTFFYITGIVIMCQVLPGIAAIILFIPITVNRIRKEEGMLLKKFGGEYNDYRRKTKALLPFLW